MNNKQLNTYYNDNNIPAFHNIIELDALKYLSELETLPKEIREDYYDQYDNYLRNMGNSTNYKLRKLLFDKFEGNGPIVIKEVVNTFSYKDIILNAVEIEIPYFKKISKYLSDIGEYRNINYKFVVLDIIIGEYSLLQQALNVPKTDHRYCPIRSIFFIINVRDYNLINSFATPYNGFSARYIPDIDKSIVEDKTKYNSISNVQSYYQMLVKIFSYTLDTTILLNKIKEIIK